MLFFWMLIIGGATIAVLVSLKGWSWMRARANRAANDAAKTAARTGGLVFATAASRIDAEVAEAEKWWPYLRRHPLFWIGCFFSGIMVILDFHFGFSRGGLAAGLVLGSLFAAADIALPFVAMKSDNGTHAWHEFEESDRSWVAWFLIVLFTFMSVIVVVGSTAELSTTTGARNEIDGGRYKETLTQIGKWQAERERLPTDRGAQALGELAKATEDAAQREAARRGCEAKCEKLKQEAMQLRAREADAKRKEELTRMIANAQDSLKGQGNARLDDDAFATLLDEASSGVIPRRATQRFGLAVIGILIVVGGTLLWMTLADQVKAEMRAEVMRRGEIADQLREQMGLAPKYTAPGSPTALLAAPATAAPTETIVVNVSAADMRRRYANDPDLLEVDGLFGTMMVPEAEAAVTVADLYKAYRVKVLTANPNARFMTQPTMAGKLVTIAHERDDVAMTADGRIIDWKLAEQPTGSVT